MNVKKWLRVAMALAAGAVLTVAGPGARAAAPGCDEAHPTFIGGKIVGYPDERALNAQISVDQRTAANVQVDKNGTPCDEGGDCCGGYSWCEYPNPDISAEGSTDPALNRSWGACVASNVTDAYIEIYPKNPDGNTDNARYGSAAHYYQPITPGAANDQIGLRLPVSWEAEPVAGLGATGWVNGYVTYQGHQIPPKNITLVRAFTTARGPECGVEGFSASAHELHPSSSIDATWYKVTHLAGGRCGAGTQEYSLRMKCSDFCGAPEVTLTKHVDIAIGRGVRVDFAF